MDNIPYGTLRNIADELKNIRKILEKQSNTEQSSIVHCKDCRWHKDYDGCFFSTAECEPEHFCSWGERSRR